MINGPSLLTGLARAFGSVQISGAQWIPTAAGEVKASGPPKESAPRVEVEISPEAHEAAEQKEVQDLQRRDREVRAHEQAHKAAGGQYAGAISYRFQTGPNGQQYAVGGSVPIDSSPIEGDPRATVQKMNQVRRAALAPGDPSGADRQIAARASQELLRAQQELAAGPPQENVGPQKEYNGETASPTNPYRRDPAPQVATLIDTLV